MWSIQPGRMDCKSRQYCGRVTFFQNITGAQLFGQKLTCCSCKKIGLRKGLSYKASFSGVAL